MKIKNTYFTENYVRFFEELEENNNKEWFNNNKAIYNEHVDKPFNEFINRVLDLIKEQDESIKIQAGDAVFRIHRDLRFSKDKTPYKVYKSALISSKGRRSKEEPGFYLEIGSKNIRIAGGCFKLKPGQIQKIECHIKLVESVSNTTIFKDYFGNLKKEESSLTFEVNLSTSLLDSNDLDYLLLKYWQVMNPVINTLKVLIKEDV